MTYYCDYMTYNGDYMTYNGDYMTYSGDYMTYNGDYMTYYGDYMTYSGDYITYYRDYMTYLFILYLSSESQLHSSIVNSSVLTVNLASKVSVNMCQSFGDITPMLLQNYLKFKQSLENSFPTPYIIIRFTYQSVSTLGSCFMGTRCVGFGLVLHLDLY
jgi:hypothetical protein